MSGRVGGAGAKGRTLSIAFFPDYSQFTSSSTSRWLLSHHPLSNSPWLLASLFSSNPWLMNSDHSSGSCLQFSCPTVLLASKPGKRPLTLNEPSNLPFLCLGFMYLAPLDKHGRAKQSGTIINSWSPVSTGPQLFLEIPLFSWAALSSGLYNYHSKLPTSFKPLPSLQYFSVLSEDNRKLCFLLYTN